VSRISIAGPSTLTALLNSLQMGFRTLALEKRSSEVWQVLGAKTEVFQVRRRAGRHQADAGARRQEYRIGGTPQPPDGAQAENRGGAEPSSRNCCWEPLTPDTDANNPCLCVFVRDIAHLYNLVQQKRAVTSRCKSGTPTYWRNLYRGRVIAPRWRKSSTSPKIRSGATCAISPPPVCARRSMAARWYAKRARERHAGAAHERQQSDKSRLAAAAVTLIAPGSILFLDAGSSNLAIACALPEVPLTVLTAPSIAAQLLEKPYRSHHDRWAYQAKPGGRSAHRTAEAELIHPDLYFVGACGVDLDAGVTAVDYEEAEFKRRLSAHSKATAVVATASKIGAVASYRVLPISQLTHLIVEAETSEAAAEAYAAAGTRLLRAGA
jgi:DeoR/GlpR family transcriptional regulator of sugar metabolism